MIKLSNKMIDQERERERVGGIRLLQNTLMKVMEERVEMVGLMDVYIYTHYACIYVCNIILYIMSTHSNNIVLI